MEIDEVMIGDWLLYKSDSLENAFPIQITREMFNKELVVWNDRFEPIHLTPEILEKNGFKKDFELKGCYWRPDCRKYCIVKEIETWYFAFRHMGGGHICISECNYLHELQHLLKLCGIDKEIVV